MQASGISCARIDCSEFSIIFVAYIYDPICNVDSRFLGWNLLHRPSFVLIKPISTIWFVLRRFSLGVCLVTLSWRSYISCNVVYLIFSYKHSLFEFEFIYSKCGHLQSGALPVDGRALWMPERRPWPCTVGDSGSSRGYEGRPRLLVLLKYVNRSVM